MNPYLRASIICFAIAAAIWAVMLIEACQHYAVFGVCRHESTYAMAVMGEKHPVRVQVGDWQGCYHCRAQAFIDGEWQWLCVDYPEVHACKGDEGFRPNQVYKPKIWMSRYGFQLKE